MSAFLFTDKTDKSYTNVVIQYRLKAKYIRIHYEDKIFIKSVGEKPRSVYECILRASMLDNDNYVRFIGVMLANGKALSDTL